MSINGCFGHTDRYTLWTICFHISVNTNKLLFLRFYLLEYLVTNKTDGSRNNDEISLLKRSFKQVLEICCIQVTTAAYILSLPKIYSSVFDAFFVDYYKMS